MASTKRMTPGQARAALGGFTKDLDKAIISGFNRGLEVVLKYVVTQRMTGGGKWAQPLPDKLRVRTGNLRRSVRIIKAKKIGGGMVFVGGLKAGNDKVPYARIHEYGGVIVPRRAKYLRFQTWDRQWHMVKRVVIPPRPYLAPAMKENQMKVYAEVEREMKALVDKVL